MKPAVRMAAARQSLGAAEGGRAGGAPGSSGRHAVAKHRIALSEVPDGAVSGWMEFAAPDPVCMPPTDRPVEA